MSIQTRLDRRAFIHLSSVAAAAGGMFGPLLARQRQARAAVGYGPLSPKGSELELPPGFNYQVISRQYDICSSSGAASWTWI